MTIKGICILNWCYIETHFSLKLKHFSSSSICLRPLVLLHWLDIMLHHSTISIPANTVIIAVFRGRHERIGCLKAFVNGVFRCIWCWIRGHHGVKYFHYWIKCLWIKTGNLCAIRLIVNASDNSKFTSCPCFFLTAAPMEVRFSIF